MSRKNELHNAIQRVFVDEGLTKRKLSGRQACIDLIDLCEQLDSSKPNNYYGYIHSGNIQECHVEHIRELYDSIWIKITLLNYKNPTLKIVLSNGTSLIKFKSNEEEFNNLKSDGFVLIDAIGRCEENNWNGRITP